MKHLFYLSILIFGLTINSSHRFIDVCEEEFIVSLKPKINDCEDRILYVNEYCEHSLVLTNSASLDSMGVCPNDSLYWQVFIDLWADGTDDFEYSSFLAKSDNVIDDTNGNGVSDLYIAPTYNDSLIVVELPKIITSAWSNHKVAWRATNSCGENRSCSYYMLIKDNLSPIVNVIDSSEVEIELDGTEIIAIDYVLSAEDNCFDASKLYYTFNECLPQFTDVIIQNRLVNKSVSHFFNKNGFVDFNGDGTVYPKAKVYTELAYENGDLYLWIPELSSSVTKINCDDLPGVDKVITIFDEYKNAVNAIHNIKVLNNYGYCCDIPMGTRISGNVTSESDEPLIDVLVFVDATMPEFPKLTSTNLEGQFAFNGLPNWNDYLIKSTYDVDYKNGISTLDMVYITRHILGLQLLDSPYKMIAADVNNSGSISGSDLLQLRNLILGLYENDDLPNNESWKFIKKDTLISIEEPWVYDETIELFNLYENTENNDFIGVKIGDVNNSVILSNVKPDTESEVRSGKTIKLFSTNSCINQGEEIELVLKSDDFEDVYGFQFTLNINGLEYKNIKPRKLDINDANIGIVNNENLTLSFDSATPISEEGSEELFVLTFIAQQYGNLSDMIALSSDITKAEIYTGAEEILINDIALAFKEESADDYKLFDILPNPVIGNAIVNFVLPAHGIVEIKVRDLQGKVWIEESFNCNSGGQYISFESKDLGSSGVYFVEMKSGDFFARKKMFFIESF